MEVSQLDRMQSTYQIFKLDIQVLAYSELCVWYGLVQVGVQIMKHLYSAKLIVTNLHMIPDEMNKNIVESHICSVALN